MTVSRHVQIVSAQALMRHHEPARIHGYCATCPQHGRVWSCPPFERLPLNDFKPWDHAVLVCQKVWTRPSDLRAEIETGRARMIERFHESRIGFRALLLEMERRHPDTTALVAGHCQVCAECTRAEGLQCRAPEAVRYSLEAVGFDVAAVAENLAGQKILWPKDHLPEYLLAVGAILCVGDATARSIQRLIKLTEERHD
jgi:predicted metal-binding protein